MMKSNILMSLNESQILLFGSMLAKACILTRIVIHLNGAVGTGKTIFCKGFLRGLGYTGCVKSPTYTLIESYCISKINVYHCDCYRLETKEELVNIGIQDYLDEESKFLVEWPKPFITFLLLPDIIITISYSDSYESYRKLIIETISAAGFHAINTTLYRTKFKYEV